MCNNFFHFLVFLRTIIFVRKAAEEPYLFKNFNQNQLSLLNKCLSCICDTLLITNFIYFLGKLIHGKLSHQCIYCGKIFGSTKGLSRHIRFHTRENLYICNVCGREFNQKSHLTVHNLLHGKGKKTFECIYCGKIYGRKHELSIHIVNDHEAIPWTEWLFQYYVVQPWIIWAKEKPNKFCGVK